MLTKANRPWPVVYHPLAFDPLIGALDQVKNAPSLADVITAAFAAADGIAAGKLTGKKLGERRVSGDLTGLNRIRFDVPGAPGNPRFRIVFAITGANAAPPEPVVRVIAIGPRVSHLVYQAALRHKGT